MTDEQKDAVERLRDAAKGKSPKHEVLVYTDEETEKEVRVHKRDMVKVSPADVLALITALGPAHAGNDIVKAQRRGHQRAGNAPEAFMQASCLLHLLDLADKLPANLPVVSGPSLPSHD